VRRSEDAFDQSSRDSRARAFFLPLNASAFRVLVPSPPLSLSFFAFLHLKKIFFLNMPSRIRDYFESSMSHFERRLSSPQSLTVARFKKGCVLRGGGGGAGITRIRALQWRRYIFRALRCSRVEMFMWITRHRVALSSLFLKSNGDARLNASTRYRDPFSLSLSLCVRLSFSIFFSPEHCDIASQIETGMRDTAGTVCSARLERYSAILNVK